LALDNLRNTIGLDASTSIRVDDPLTFQAVDDTVVANAEALMLDVNPNLQAVKRQMNLNDAAVFAERSSYLPIVSAFGQYQFQAAKNEFNFNRRDFIRSSQVGISVSLNVFQGFQTYSRVEQAQLERRKSEEQHVSLERSLRMGLNSVKGNLGSARKRIDAQDKTVETAERGYKIVTARFLASAATQLEVNDAQLALVQARVNRLQAIYDYLVAAADLDQFLGRVPAYVNGLED
ncbi:MAG: TolC family protein, partial [Bacteroidetes bacterium]|nr:TolC family protein [Bacteroidota bacterium]